MLDFKGEAGFTITPLSALYEADDADAAIIARAPVGALAQYVFTAQLRNKHAELEAFLFKGDNSSEGQRIDHEIGKIEWIPKNFRHILQFASSLAINEYNGTQRACTNVNLEFALSKE